MKEGAGSTNFTVTATHDGDPQDTDPVEIQLSLDGTADRRDRQGLHGPGIRQRDHPANQTSGSETLTLTIIDDSEVEGTRPLLSTAAMKA